MSLQFRDVLETLAGGENLEPELASAALGSIVRGEVGNEEVAAFLFGLRQKGETVAELTEFVKVMRQASVKVNVDTEGAVDLCGTGGDRSGTFNISTAAMFVVAGAGIPVLKHGNRSISSRSGSADVLEALGAVADLNREGVEEVFKQTQIAFMFAPNFHPAMKFVMPARRALGIRTCFNILGPLLNPAGVRRQVIGAFNSATAGTICNILDELKAEKVYSLHARDGLDEVSLTADTELYKVPSDPGKNPELFDPGSLGFKKVDAESLAGGNAETNAAIILSILNGSAVDAQRDIVLLNAAFGIEVSGKTDSRAEAVEMARESLLSGRAGKKLDEFAGASRQAAERYQ